MAHKTLVNATAYEISGGRTLVNGTGYSIDKGKTLVGGTAYEVGFGHPVLIAGGGIGLIGGNFYTVTVDGNSYPVTSAWEVSTVSTAEMVITSTSTMPNSNITLNGEIVFTGAGEYTVDLSNATHVVLTRQMTNLVITTYDIPTQKDVTVTVTGTGYGSYAGIEYNGVAYTSAATFTAKTGDFIRVRASNALGTSDYYHLVTSDMLVTLTFNNNAGTSSAPVGSVGIKEIPEGHALVMIKYNGNATDCYVSVDGVQYISATSVVVPIGTEIYCKVVAGSSEPSFIRVNGTKVVETGSSGYVEYILTVNYNTEISMSYGLGQYASSISIIEIPEGYAYVKLTGVGNVNTVYLTIDGVKYSSEGTIVVPIGTIIACKANVNDNDQYGYVSVNGSSVATNGNGYNYVVNVNVSVYMYAFKGGGYITITEQ